jgi:signal transduction histidine kinase
MWLDIAVCFLVLSIFVLGSFVGLRGLKSRINITFAIFSYIMAIWILFNYMGANYKEGDFASIATRVDFILGCFLVYVSWLFTTALLKKADIHKKYAILYSSGANLVALFLAAVSALLTFASNVLSITQQPNTPLRVDYGDSYYLFGVGLAIIMVALAINLFLSIRIAKGRLKQQLYFLFWALFVAVLIVGFANLLLPQISDSDEVNLITGNLSYIGIVFLVAVTSYSIVKHRLFDLRLVLARSLAYILLLAVLVVGYGLITLTISSLIVEDFELFGSSSIVPIVSIVLLAFTVNPLIRLFNKLTNRIFYKDSYEPQQFLGDLNETIISNVEVNSLLDKVSTIVETYLKSDNCAFFVDLGNKQIMRPAEVSLTNKIKAAFTLADAQDSRVIVTDEFLASEHDSNRGMLENLGIGVISTISSVHGQRIGYVLLGNKKNGATYTSQDIEMVQIMSGELGIAIQNAARFEEIERFSETLKRKIEEATGQLRRQNDRLKLLDQTKDDFIGMASHQLRTPLTAIKGYLSMVLEGDAGKLTPLQKRMLSQSFMSAQRMVYLISDLLNVSRLRTGKFSLEMVPTNLAQVVQDEIKQLKEAAKVRSLNLTYEKPEDFPTYLLDETKLRQVIMNFIDNAVYYTPGGGSIKILLNNKPQSIEFIVSDTGIGVPKGEQQHMFTKYYRAHNAQVARPDGTGLGLFMAKKVIIAHGGAVIFKSIENRGSSFGFTIPKSALKKPLITPGSDHKNT